MVNIKKIESQIQKSGTTFEKMAEEMGLDPVVLTHKLYEHEGEFLTVREAQEIVDFLKLPKEQASDIFFAE